MKVLNLYAGVGGNRKLWTDCEVTAVEITQKIADVYSAQHPQDEMIIGDAHEYLRKNFRDFDFIWSSPPCQSHSQMAVATRHQNRVYPDLSLYEEILFLQAQHKGAWMVENVVPHYEPLITPSVKVGRHLMWSNFDLYVHDVPSPGGFINATNTAGANAMKKWLGIEYDKPVYYDGNHCPAQVYRNCVHPQIGLQVFECARGHLNNDNGFRISQGSLFA